MPETITHPDRPSEYLHGGVISIDNRNTPSTTLTVDLRWLKGDQPSQPNFVNRTLVFDPTDETDMAIYLGLKAKVLAELQALQAELQAAKDERESVTTIDKEEV